MVEEMNKLGNTSADIKKYDELKTTKRTLFKSKAIFRKGKRNRPERCSNYQNIETGRVVYSRLAI